jgi:hypothetical protein
MNFVYKIFFLLCITSLWFSLSSYESGAASRNRSATGAPFGNGNCGSCHNGGTYGTVNVAVQIFEVGTTTAVTAYTAGKAYDAKLSITSTSAAPFYAFQMVAVNAANAQAGTWSGFPANVKGSVLAARTYVEQSVKLTASSYKMTWTAPAAGTGAVKFYACGNAVDGTGDEANDNAGIVNITLNEQVTPVCTSATVTTASVNAACTSSTTGSATATPTGGALPYTYLWSNGATTQTVSNLLAGTYTVTVTEGGGCKTPSTVTIGANTPTATITASGSTALCTGGSVNLTASGGSFYTWSTGGTTATLSNILASGTYSVTVANGACTATTSKVVTVLPAPTAAITASGSTICQGNSLNLTASGGSFYTWSTGATSATIGATTAGTYSVTVSNGSCTATASKALTTSPSPTATIVASGPTSFCQGGSVGLTASGGTAYVWSNGATTASTTVSLSGTYTVSVTNNGCVGTTNKVITTIPAPTVRLTGTPSTGTSGTATATASGGTLPYIYDWSNNATNYTLIGLRPGTYFVTVTDANGCIGEGSIVIGTTTGVKDVEQFPVSISPMPNDGHFLLTLELPTEQNIHVDMFNMVGQKVDKKVLFGKSIAERMDVSNLPSGQYLVKINTESGIATRWMMIAR